jgi:hypothetical protein
MRDGDVDVKFGMSGAITARIGGYRTSNPYCKVLSVMYTEESLLLENMLRKKYDKKLLLSNREFISNVPLGELVAVLKSLADSLELSYTFESEEELEKFNSHILPLNILEEPPQSQEEKEVEIPTKRCGGFTHTTEESRMVAVNKFFKNAGNSDGYNRICKDCHLTAVYGDKRKIQKVVKIPKYDKSTHKWCNRCESVKEHSHYFNDQKTVDGLGANCKECKKEQKQSYIKKKKDATAELQIQE